MAQVIEDRIRETTTTTGTGDIALSGAMTGFRSFSSVCSTNDTVYCCVVAVDSAGNPTGDWEVGNYTYTSSNALARTVVLSSSNNNLHVNFPAGTKHIFLDLAAYQIGQFAKAGATAPSPTSPSGLWPYGWSSPENSFETLAFQDEFNGVALDTSIWHDRIWYRRSATSVKNYKVENGNLLIWPVRDSNATGCTKNGNNFVEREITSDGRKSFQYGYFESRMKLPIGQGTFPAFWLFNHQKSEGTLHTEIDVMEAYSSNTAYGWSSSDKHPMDYVGTVWNNQVSLDKAGDVRLFGGTGSDHPQVDLSAAYHVYGAFWDSTGVRFYFDGKQIAPNRNDGNVVNGKINVTQANFSSRPMYLLFDLWFTDPDSTTPLGEGNALLVDYVRVWPLKNP